MTATPTEPASTKRRKFLKHAAYASKANASVTPAPIKPHNLKRAVRREGPNMDPRKSAPAFLPQPENLRPPPPKGPWFVEDLDNGTTRVRANLHPGQSAAMRSSARFTLMLAGSQSGKTSLGPLWLEREIRLRGPGDYMAVTPTYTLLKAKMLPEFLRLFKDTMNLGAWSKGDKTFTFWDGETRIMFGSATNPESLESATAKGAWLDEVGQNQFRLESWEAIQRRISMNMGRVLFTTTPYNSGWLKGEIYDRAIAGDPDYKVIQFASTMNPAFPKEELARVERTQQGWKVRMFYKGLFDRPPNSIYPDYIDEYRENGGHLVKPFPGGIPHWWPRYIGQDFGGSNQARVFLARDPISGVYYAYDEELGGNMTVKLHVQEVWRRLGGAILVGAWGGSRSEEAWRVEFSAHGLIMQPPPVFDVELGIDAVTRLLKERQLMVVDTLKGLRDEFGSYSRKMMPDGLVRPEIHEKNTYHRLDALRYVALGIRGATDLIPVVSYGSATGWQPGR